MHPWGEAWPEAQRAQAFARLQQRMVTVDVALSHRRERRCVVLPSRSVDRWHEPPAESQAYEERLLSSLFELRDPRLQMTYVTSSPIDPRTVDYYLSLIPGQSGRSARRRLTLVSVGDRGGRPLSEKLLERPSVLERIRRAILGRGPSYLVPYHSSTPERDLALMLGIPMYGPAPRHTYLGTKSGGRELFAIAGVPCPLGVEHVSSLADAVRATITLRAAKPNLDKLVVKLNDGVSGEGNAVVCLAGLPPPGAPGEELQIRRRLAKLVTVDDSVTPSAYLNKLAVQGGIVEELITGRQLRSPSVQCEVTPAGQVNVLSTHDQILTGPTGHEYHGCRFPADPAYAPAVARLARLAAARLAEIGVIGRFAIDFVVTRTDAGRWEAFALELNLRLGGTTHPYQALAHLAGGAYDEHSATFTTPEGEPRHYVATDHLEPPGLDQLGRAGVLALARQSALRYDSGRRVGAVFHMLSSVSELGRAGFTAIGRSADHAQTLFHDVQATVEREAARRARATRTSRLSHPRQFVAILAPPDQVASP